MDYISTQPKLKNVNILNYKSHGQIRIKASLEKLVEIAKTNKWIHELDEIQMTEDIETDIENELTRENEELRKRIEELEEARRHYASDPLFGNEARAALGETK